MMNYSVVTLLHLIVTPNMGSSNTLAHFIIITSLLLASLTDAATIVESLPNDAEADYVVVGGGIGGLVTANRLSAAGASVIVIEAGPNGQNEALINDPFQYIALLGTGQFNWNWPTVNQTVGGSQKIIAGGKVIGGSSSINGMDWTRGSKEQYNTIAALNYDDSWGWTKFSAFMKKAEHFVPPSKLVLSHGATYEASAHGFNGLLKAGYPNPWNGWAFGKLFVKAAKSTWKLEKGDVCNGNPNVAAQNAFSIGVDKNGASIRSSSARGYIYPFLGDKAHDGLLVLPGHQGTRIVWAKTNDGGKAVATGVEYAPTVGVKTKKVVRARKEVIVAAGTIQSPAFLQLSGIGEKKHLASVGIKQVVDLPSVGTNLQDQALATNLYAAGPPYDTDPAFASPVQNLAGSCMAYPNIEQLFGQARASLLIKKLRSTLESRAKNIVKTGGAVSASGLSRVFKSQIDLIENGTPLGEAECGLAFGFYACVSWPLLPQNRGTVKIVSNDPFQYPQIDPRYLDNDFDLTVAATLFKTARKALHLPFVAKTWAAEQLPPPTLPVDASDSQYAVYIASTYAPVYHPIGSVPMLPQKDGGAVDSRLRVYGTKNVRTIDASILPVQLSAHLSSTVYGIAEKGASMILEDNH